MLFRSWAGHVVKERLHVRKQRHVTLTSCEHKELRRTEVVERGREVRQSMGDLRPRMAEAGPRWYSVEAPAARLVPVACLLRRGRISALVSSAK